jgi:hypothetical protein
MSPEIVLEVFGAFLQPPIDLVDSPDMLEEVGETGHQEIVPAHYVHKEVLGNLLHLKQVNDKLKVPDQESLPIRLGKVKKK